MDWRSRIRKVVSDIYRSRTIKVSIALIASYLAVSYAFDYELVGQFLGWVWIAVSLSIIIAWGGQAVLAFRARRLSGWQALIIGVNLGWLSILSLGFWAALGRAANFNTQLVQSRVTGFIILVSIVSGVMHVTAIGADEPRLPGTVIPRNWRLIVGAITIGLVTATALAIGSSYLGGG